MEVGTISPEGYHQWDGEKWLPVELGKVSEDGYWIWNGEKWVPNSVVRTTAKVEDSSQNYSEDTLIGQNDFVLNQDMIIIQSEKQKLGFFNKLSLAIVIPIVIVAILVIGSGIAYVLMDDSIFSENDRTIEGTWYNPADTITFYPNGTVSESSGVITKWSVEGGNLTTTFQIDDDEIDVLWIYEIKFDDEGDSFLFMALYQIDNGVQTNTVNETSCIGYSDSITSSENVNFEDRTLIFPDWCNPEEK